jgi:hypothetical protein
MVQLDGYSLSIMGGGWRGTAPEKDQLVPCEDGSTFMIVLKNGNNTPCEAEVTLDGKQQGTWVMKPHEQCILERPTHKKQLFTFVFVEKHGAAAGLTAGSPTNGLVSVKFTPEKKKPTFSFGFGARTAEGCEGCEDMDGDDDVCEMAPAGFSFGIKRRSGESRGATRSYKEGGTCLTGSSSQQFNSVKGLDLDHEAARSLHLRLVGKEPDSNSITPLTDCRGPRSTAVPPPVQSV